MWRSWRGDSVRWHRQGCISVSSCICHTCSSSSTSSSDPTWDLWSVNRTPSLPWNPSFEASSENLSSLPLSSYLELTLTMNSLPSLPPPPPFMISATIMTSDSDGFINYSIRRIHQLLHPTDSFITFHLYLYRRNEQKLKLK